MYVSSSVASRSVASGMSGGGQDTGTRRTDGGGVRSFRSLPVEGGRREVACTEGEWRGETGT